LRGADLTRRLLAFARRQPLQPKRVDLNPLVENITRLLSRTLGEAIVIDVRLGGDVWPVMIDPAQLDSSLTNLATNARDAMPNGGRLSVTTGNRHLDADYAAQHAELAPGDYAMIEVTDTGTGMDADTTVRIFEPFFTTKEQGKGTGLGLSMVHGFIEQSGGHINVYSEPGIGTTFRLYLPRAAAEPAVAADAPMSALRRGSGQTALAVEDNPSRSAAS
jgi:signal transduction histidine kinase